MSEGSVAVSPEMRALEEKLKGKYIHCRFKGKSASGKTDIFEVVAKEFRGEEEILGEIRWYAPWRCYAFCVDEYVFEHQCLSDLARCCFSLTSDHLLARTRGRKQK